MDPSAVAVADVVLARIAPGDDPALWRLVIAATTHQASGLLREMEPRPRRMVVTFACIPRRHPRTHPDEAAHWRLSFARERDEANWAAAGTTPHVKRRRGHHWLTVCVPAGTQRLAACEVMCLWRPRFPWAEPTDTEIGRETRLFLRDAGGAWEARGVR